MFSSLFKKPAESSTNHELGLCLLFVTLLSFFTYFHRYWDPPAVFWDENYHIAAAQKYLNGVYFMEPHPPLGKLLIALGEKIVNANPDAPVGVGDAQFLGTDYGRTFPPGFSFAGYRLFPALLAWLTAPLLFLCFWLILRNPLQSALVSFLYVFDTALIVHQRGAMLESTLMFFSVAVILGFLLVYRYRDDRKAVLRASILMGAAFGAVMTTKALGLIMVLFIPAAWWFLRRNGPLFARAAVATGLSFLIVYGGVWYTHFALGKTINTSLPDKGMYQASPQLQQVLANRKTAALAAFPLQLRDHLKFLSHYSKGAPRLDLCKADENGSPSFLWPVGARAINYRWETPDGSAHRYLYLQSNPVVWFGGLLAVLIGLGMLAGAVINPPKKPLQEPLLLLLFTGVWVAYMIAVSRIDRVMYLYHYFTPLMFTFFAVALVARNIQSIWKWDLEEDHRTTGLLVLGALIVLGFQFYRPFAYYEPLTTAQFQRRDIFRLWELTCVGDGCSKDSALVVPR